MENGEFVYGPFMKTTDPSFVEIAGLAGFDFVILDMEHGSFSFENLPNLLRAAQVSGLFPVVRTANSDPLHISKALDAGALGIQVPQVQSADEAARCIHAAKYYPNGERGLCCFVRAAGFSSQKGSTFLNNANQTMVILQLEGKKALDNLDEILAVKGFDILFVGPYDLSQSLGFPGQVDHPVVVTEIRNIVTMAREKNRVVGVFADTPDALHLWKKQGVQYLSYKVDVGIFMDACKRELELIK